MSYFRSHLILLVLSLLSCNSNADSYKVINVASNDVLNVRSEASSNSVLVGALAHNTNNIALTGKETKRGESLWVEIKHGNITGWVNSRYIEKQSSNDTLLTDQALSNLKCNGSEPDWILAFDTIKKSIEFESISSEKKFFISQEIKQSKNNTNKWFINAIAKNSKEKLSLSLIETNQCSDDMSDFYYKYSLTINIEGNGVYSGCCNRLKQ